MIRKNLQIAQLDKKLKPFSALRKIVIPASGWIRVIRSSLGMSQQQLAHRLGITKQSVQQLEIREKEGTISLNTLREVARALDMQLVYGLVPNDGSLDALIEKRAKELATQIVLRTSQSMKLEDQENSPRRIQKAIKERTALLKSEMPGILWD